MRLVQQLSHALTEHTLHALLRRYGAGDALSCEPVSQGLLNRGYRLVTSRGRFFLKHHLDNHQLDGDPVAPDGLARIERQHRATARLGALGLPVVPPVPDTEGRTVAVIGGRCYALHPWVDGRHRHGAELSVAQSRELGALLGRVHTRLGQVIPAPTAPSPASADPESTHALIDELLSRVRAQRRGDSFDALAERRLLERRVLLRRYADCRPAPESVPAVGWVHGDFHPLNLLYAVDGPDRGAVDGPGCERTRASVGKPGSADGPRLAVERRSAVGEWRAEAGGCASSWAADQRTRTPPPGAVGPPASAGSPGSVGPSERLGCTESAGESGEWTESAGVPAPAGPWESVPALGTVGAEAPAPEGPAPEGSTADVATPGGYTADGHTADGLMGAEAVGGCGQRPLAIVDWDRLAVLPRAEEAVRGAAIFFIGPDGTLDLEKVRAYARAYRRAASAGPGELSAAVHRVWWERLNDFWMLCWRYQLGDRRTDWQFPAASALVAWWCEQYEAVRSAFCD